MPSIFTVTDLQAELANIKQEYGVKAYFNIDEKQIAIGSSEENIFAWGSSVHEVLKAFHTKCSDRDRLRRKAAALHAEEIIGL